MYRNIFIELLRSDGSIIINKKMAQKIGLNETIIYSELLSFYNYYLKKEKLINNYFYCTIEKLKENTTLTRYQQDKAIKTLINIGLIKTKNIGLPLKRHFTINFDINLLNEIISNPSKIQFVKNQQACLRNTDKLGCKKLTTNNTNNNTNINNTNQSINQEKKIDGLMDYKSIISENISLEALKADYNNNPEIDNIFSLIVEVVTSNKECITISGENKSIDMVRAVFLKLNESHIRYLLDSLDNAKKIKNIKAYIITSLYNSYSTIDLHYKNKLNDLY